MSRTPNDHRAQSRPDSPGPKEAGGRARRGWPSKTRVIDALRPGRAVRVIGARAADEHPANPKSSTSGMRIAGTPRMRMSQSMRIRMPTVVRRHRICRTAMGCATDKSDEFPPPHGLTSQGQGSRPNHNTAHRSKKRSLIFAEGQNRKYSGRVYVFRFTSVNDTRARMPVYRSVPSASFRAPPNQRRYSITSSARASSGGGTVRPSALAVLRLIASSNLVGCRNGRSAGFAPLRIRPT